MKSPNWSKARSHAGAAQKGTPTPTASRQAYGGYGVGTKPMAKSTTKKK